MVGEVREGMVVVVGGGSGDCCRSITLYFSRVDFRGDTIYLKIKSHQNQYFIGLIGGVLNDDWKTLLLLEVNLSRFVFQLSQQNGILLPLGVATINTDCSATVLAYY